MSGYQHNAKRSKPHLLNLQFVSPVKRIQRTFIRNEYEHWIQRMKLESFFLICGRVWANLINPWWFAICGYIWHWQNPLSKMPNASSLTTHPALLFPIQFRLHLEMHLEPQMIDSQSEHDAIQQQLQIVINSQI